MLSGQHQAMFCITHSALIANMGKSFLRNAGLMLATVKGCGATQTHSALTNIWPC